MLRFSTWQQVEGFSAQPRAEQNVTSPCGNARNPHLGFSAQPRAEQNVTVFVNLATGCGGVTFQCSTTSRTECNLLKCPQSVPKQRQFQCSTTSRTECNLGHILNFAYPVRQFQCSTTSRTECNARDSGGRPSCVSCFSAQPRAEQNVTLTANKSLWWTASFSAQPRAEQNVTIARS